MTLPRLEPNVGQSLLHSSYGCMTTERRAIQVDVSPLQAEMGHGAHLVVYVYANQLG